MLAAIVPQDFHWIGMYEGEKEQSWHNPNNNMYVITIKSYTHFEI